VSRVVPDTNVTISATFWRGHPRRVFEPARQGRVTLLWSAPIEAELIRVLSYPKFGLVATELLPIVSDIRRIVEPVEATSKGEVVRDDPTDNVFLECALDGAADYIVSGDRHLLALGEYQGVRIATARDFLAAQGFI